MKETKTIRSYRKDAECLKVIAKEQKLGTIADSISFLIRQYIVLQELKSCP